MATMKPQPLKLPKSLAQCADLLYATRQERLVLKKDVDAHQAIETALKERLINELPKGEASGIAGKLARVTISTKKIPQVNDWDEVYKFVLTEGIKHLRKKNGRELELFALFQRTIVSSMVEELWEAGVEIPGVGTFNTVTVGVSKV